MEEYQKKGTTTVAIACKDSIVLAADKRASMGYLVAGKEVEKISKITEFIAMTSAGMVGDLQKLAIYLKAEMELYKLERKMEPTATVASTLLSNMVFAQAKSFIPYMIQIILAGKDNGGFSIFSIDMAGGNIKESKFDSTGSGSPMAYGVLEDNFEDDLSTEDGVQLAIRALASAIKRDLATGEGVDVVIIDASGFHRCDKAKIKKALEAKAVRL